MNLGSTGFCGPCLAKAVQPWDDSGCLLIGQPKFRKETLTPRLPHRRRHRIFLLKIGEEATYRQKLIKMDEKNHSFDGLRNVRTERYIV